MINAYVLLLSVATLLVQQPPAGQSADSTSSPIPGVERPGQGVSAPVLLHETKPNYTPEAMRARIQGLIAMECVVEPDGSVGPVRVTRSLDAIYGLDEQAIRTLKQWRFRPGTKDGVPVRVLVKVEMSYTLRERADVRVPASPAVRPGDVVPLGWPASFNAREIPGTSPSTWVDGSIETPALAVSYSYPATWSILKSNETDHLITLYAEDANGTRTVTLSQPQPSPFTLSEPLSQAGLDAFTVAAGASAAFLSNVRHIGSGQVVRQGGLWIWFEMAAASFAAWNAPPALADRLRTGYDGMHVWTFATTAAGQSLAVFCAVVHRANMSEADKQEEIRRSAAEFGAILKRISIQSR